MGDKKKTKKQKKNKANTRNQFSNCEYMFTLSTILAKKNYEKTQGKKLKQNLEIDRSGFRCCN